MSVQGLKATNARGRSREINRKRLAEDDLHPMLLEMEEKMFMLR